MKVYLLSDEDMQGLLDQLQLKTMSDMNVLIHPDQWDKLSPEEHNRLNSVHRAFHFVAVRWLQSHGYKGHR